MTLALSQPLPSVLAPRLPTTGFPPERTDTNTASAPDPAGDVTPLYRTAVANDAAPRRALPANDIPLSPPSISTDLQRADALGGLNRTLARPVVLDMATLMALFLEVSQQQRKSARDIREASLTAQITALHKVSELMNDAANKRFTGAILANTIRLGTGIVQGRFAVSMAKTGAGDTGNMQALQLRGQSLGELSGAVGGFINAGFEREAARLDATQKTVEAQSRRDEAEVNYAGELMQTMLDAIRDTKERLAAIESSRADTARGMIRNI